MRLLQQKLPKCQPSNANLEEVQSKWGQQKWGELQVWIGAPDSGKPSSSREERIQELSKLVGLKLQATFSSGMWIIGFKYSKTSFAIFQLGTLRFWIYVLPWLWNIAKLNLHMEFINIYCWEGLEKTRTKWWGETYMLEPIIHFNRKKKKSKIWDIVWNSRGPCIKEEPD